MLVLLCKNVLGVILPIYRNEDNHTGSAGLSPEGVCSMFRTVGKVVSNLGFSDEVSVLCTYTIYRNYSVCMKIPMYVQ